MLIPAGTALRIGFTIVLVVFATASTAMARPLTASERRALPAALAEGMRDPSSAQFRFTQVARTSVGGQVVCGVVNARNGFGGMTGFQPFIAIISGAEVSRPFIVAVGNPTTVAGQEAEKICRAYGLDPAAAP